MLSDYERELSTHYAQVRKRLRGEPPKQIMAIPPRPAPEPEPVVEPEPEPVFEPKTVSGLAKTHIICNGDFVSVNGSSGQYGHLRRSFKDVLNDVSRETGVPKEHIMGHQRLKHMVDARRFFWWRVVNECPHLSIAEIGRRSGHDHTTVLHGVKRYEDILSGEFVDYRLKNISKPEREREKNGRYVRYRATGRKWCGLLGYKKGVE